MTTVTLQDAITALDEGNLSIVRAFFKRLDSLDKPCTIDSDATGYIVDGAYQHGFETVDDNGDLLIVATTDLINFVKLQRGEVVK